MPAKRNYKSVRLDEESEFYQPYVIHQNGFYSSDHLNAWITVNDYLNTWG